MILLILSVTVVAIFSALWAADRYDQTWPVICSFCSYGFLMVVLIAFISLRTQCPAYVEKIHATQRTLDEQRKDGLIENAAITNKIIEVNAELAEDQYWANNPWVSAFYTDAVRNLQPIK